jgi:UDP-N-acetylmuramoyl-tripeptide--D-alanyl-D-alanine ligase
VAEVALDEVLLALTGTDPGRLEPVALPGGAYLLLDDSKSPTETIGAALDVLAEIPAARRVVVLGDVSEPVGSTRPLYRRLGAHVARVASRAVFITGDNIGAYMAGAKAGGLPRDARLHAGRSFRRAAAAIAADLRPGDVVLVKGRHSQRLERLALLLSGRQVRCELMECTVRIVRCQACPMLERGWGGGPGVK